ncbi:growth arrest and DNA damage-inducible proteins-interacting protein 1 [Gouania willdenowi]|uniref:Large ribosomal subunit protein mL64 n=1 Tax=Gouania willdenowi TaxID=441366 RepID=A0A8C5G2I3_GOUWI|nr:growth arrest and DNA damage-inducible proteins-interacting protein 1 [Gouania willdenowi]
MMAASVLLGRTTALCRTLKAITSSKAESCCPVLIQTASYNPKPLRLSIRGPYIPDKDSEKTPEWQKTARYDAKLFGRYGSASGIDPVTLWPSAAQLEKMIAEEQQWHPPVEVMLRNIEAREEEETEKRLAKEKLIAENMAKMPKMIDDWRREKREAKQKLKDEKARRARLLAEAKERFGHALDPRSNKFQEMMAEIEKEEKKKKKLLKRRQREEQLGLVQNGPPAEST